MRICIKGVTPIEKNIIVVDEQGNEYEATYPRRAKGLVKNGRARFIDENKICLACPPDIISEDKMEDNRIDIQDKKTTEVILTVRDILDAVERVNSDKEFLLKTMESIVRIDPAGGPGDNTGPAKAQAIADIVKCVETTSQSKLAIYEKMYDDAVSDADSEKVRLAKMLLEFADKTDDQAVLYQKNEIMNTVRYCSGFGGSEKVALAKMMLDFAISSDDEDILGIKNSIIETLNSFIESDS